MPPPGCLTAFGERVPASVVSQYLTVLMHYPDFEPTPSGRELRRALVEAAVRYGDATAVYDVVLWLAIDAFPQDAVRDAMSYLLERGLNAEAHPLRPANEIEAAWLFVDFLLDAKATRRATVDNLRVWALTDSFPEIIACVWPRLDAEERARLEVA